MGSNRKKEILDKLNYTSQVKERDITEKLNVIHEELDNEKVSSRLNQLISENMIIEDKLTL
ncbi:hypothetical protein [Tenacibaculum aiptasiae]|uniref:hypothetical protein n=1 Tax=Tenacibaculum aiptasiae TaxID=426481 RepID=UPI002330F6F1|nr:hypothetical protein [Tenacibaculum aiptasiae]